MASVAMALNSQTASLIGSEKSLGYRSGGFVKLPSFSVNERRVGTVRMGDLLKKSSRLVSSGHDKELKVLCCCAKSIPENFHNSVGEALILKRKAEDVLPYLSGRCIYLVGMMGSGKSTVGKIMAEVLGYSYFDSDKLVEQAVGLPSVAQIFKEHSEAFFRDNESEVLKDLSSMRRLVVATGGGAVIRPVNWKYMKQGVTVWLDVPLDALARRIAAVGTASRPLLDEESGDPYTKAFMKLTTLKEQRGDAYANADIRVSLEYIASKQGLTDVCALTPSEIAIESLTRIEMQLKEKAAVANRRYYQA